MLINYVDSAYKRVFYKVTQLSAFQAWKRIDKPNEVRIFTLK